MSADQMNATITKGGEVEFPQWVKVLAWIVGLSFPVAILCAAWIGGKIWEMSTSITEMRTEIRISRADSYGAAAATAAHQAIDQRIDRNERDIQEIRSQLGVD